MGISLKLYSSNNLAGNVAIGCTVNEAWGDEVPAVVVYQGIVSDVRVSHYFASASLLMCES